MKKKTQWRCCGGAIIIFNLWLIGQYNITGVAALLLTFGVAALVEGLVAMLPSEGRPALAPDPTITPRKPSPIVIYGGGLLFAAMLAATVSTWFSRGHPPPEAAVATGGGAFSPNDRPIPMASATTPITFQYEDAFPPAPKALGFIDQWRFDSCMTDAAKNPTVHGVNTAVRVCRRRFGQ